MPPIKTSFLSCILFFCGWSAQAQNGGNNWTFGRGCGLHFNADGTVTQFASQVNSREGVATASDPATGDLLFYTDGTQIWDATDNVMLNGSGLLGEYSSAQSAVIVPKPGDSLRYYVFTAPHLSSPNGYRYSVVNTAGNNGLGAVESATKNTLLLQNGTEKIGLARHCNGRDFWLILRESGGNNFWVYLINENGVQSPQKFSLGATLQESTWNEVGYMRVSSDEKTLVHPIGPDFNGNFSSVELFHFDNTTGAISGPFVTLTGFGFAYGAEFSADSKLLYLSDISGPSGIPSAVYQYNLSSGNAQTITNSQVQLIAASDYAYGAIQLAPNGKMYVTKEHGYDIGSSYLDVINSPSVPGTGCNYVLNGLTLTTGTTLVGLPHADYRPYQPPPQEVAVPLCENVLFYISGVAYAAPDTVVVPEGPCDLLTRYILTTIPHPKIAQTIALCPNQSVTIGGNVYTEPGIVVDTIPSTSGGCDTIATYTILRVDNPKLQQLVSFCSGDSVVINGVTYTQADTAISYVIPASVGCDTLVEVFLSYSPPPSVTRTVAFCSGDSVILNGIAYFQPGTVTGIIPAATGCDTLATYVLEFLPQPTVTKTLAFCSGDSVILNGIAYFQPGTVTGIIPAVTGCDTLATYVLEFLPQPTVTKTLAFCPGASVSIEGVTYTQPGTVSGVIAATSGCDTLVTYTLQFAPQPTRSQTIEFCNGNSVTIGGTVYTQPGTVLDTVVSTTGGCDTLVTYTLQHPVPSHPTAITLNCPNDLFVDADPGQISVPVVYAVPVATSDCPCPGVALNLQQGLVSGSNFPLGMTDVCYHAKDSCGNAITCCFNVTVEEKPACDVKEINCIKFELLGITADAQQRKTYRIRTTNNCTNRLLYLAIQVPDGIVADQPLNNATYTAASGRTYVVRNPNFSPFYSVRFSSVGDSIHNGESDVFQYTLPVQADPDYIHVTVRLEPGIFYEAHLNTFFCPIEYEPNNNRQQQYRLGKNHLNLFPNPTDGALFADLSAWVGQQVQLQIFNVQGGLIRSMAVIAGTQAQSVELPATLPNGLYLLELTLADGSKQTKRFTKQY